MKTTEIVGFRREEVGTASSKRLRAEGNVPCVLYGGDDNIHFHAPAILFRDLLYTPDAYIVNLNVEGTEKRAVLQDVQFHPVSEMILHCDFLEIFDDKEVSIEAPVKLHGNAPGVLAGGQIYVKNKKLKVKALPGNLPEFINIDISNLELGKAVRVKDIKTENYEVLHNPQVAIAQIIIPRALKSAQGAEGLEEGGEAEGEAEGEAAAAE